MGFWTSRSGKQITGKAEDAFTRDFELIPNNTTAIAQIKSFVNAKTKDGALTHLEIIWKITSDKFKGREVRQKIKCFDGKEEQIDRALNMLKLIMDLCGFKPTHNDAPTDADLMKMNGKVCGIKIREFAMPKSDGPGYTQGNFVAEVHPAADFKCEVGEKLELAPLPANDFGYSAIAPVDSAFSRNQVPNVTADDIPF